VRGQDGVLLPAGTVGYVFQDYPLLQHRTVRSNLELAGTIAGMSIAESASRATKLMETFNLTERAGFFPARLSGGQRQRVAIAQQIMRPRQLVLMDEPFSGLDPAALGNVMDLVQEVAHLDELNTIVLVTHDIRAAMAVSDTVHMLGRAKNDKGVLVSGASIRETYDMVERGLAWKKGIESTAAFIALEHEISARFHDL
jgi:ABC-type nitrate/sulfonate/bicarbonate transport system ATPase subunit